MGSIKKKKETVCIASADVASTFMDFRSAFNDLGYDVITYVNDKPEQNGIIQNDKYDYWKSRYVPSVFKILDWPFWKQKAPWSINRHFHKLRESFISKSFQWQFRSILKKADLFVFVSASFNEDSTDLEMLKRHGKKVVFIFVGDDARWYYGMKQDFEMHGLHPYKYPASYDYSVNGLYFRLRKIRMAEKYADLICSKREQSQLQVRDFMHFPMIVNPNDYEPSFAQRKQNPVVVHAPSNPQVKGTKHILEAVEQLKKEGIVFEFRLIENMKHVDALEAYRNADIIIDQVYIPGAGKLASEAMAYGKVVMGLMAYGKYEQGFPVSDCPIIDISPETVATELRKIILDHDRREQLAFAGPVYVEKYLDINKFCAAISDFLVSEKMTHPYKPVFFREHYKPESEEAKECINRWSAFIANEDFCKDMELHKN